MKLVHAAPETAEPEPAWQDSASCTGPEHDDHRDLWYAPDSDHKGVAYAVSICKQCPVIQECAAAAFASGEKFGIWGGMTARKRKAALRRATRRSRAQPIQAGASKQPPPQTLEEAFNRRTHRTGDGHIVWEGNVTFKFKGTAHNALRMAFARGHGRDPEGPVDRLCDQVCFAPEHLIDSVLKASGALCGTRRGYYWHQRVGQPTCVPCRQANTDADNRLRRTGTTKAAA